MGIMAFVKESTDMNSKLNKGANFTISLPLNKNKYFEEKRIENID